MARQGVDIIDVGGESTRPGAAEVDAKEEMRRVIPVIKAIVKATGVPVSIDTRKADVADAAVNAGAKIINDVSGLRHDKKMAYVAGKHGAAVIIMHSRGSPADMQRMAVYKDIVADVVADIRVSIEAAIGAGVSEKAIIIDPGIGFAKTSEQSLEILGRLDELKVLRRPVCVGVSRKSFIGHVLGQAGTDERLAGTVAACAIAVINGARILRVHDVKEAKDAARVTDSVARTVCGIRAN
jgi:dihydropteroate synthase